MPCYTPFPDVPHHKWIERMLCQAMSFLSVEQIGSIKTCDGYISAHNWYCSHLYSDFLEAFEKKDETAMNRYRKEVERMGSTICIDKDEYDGRPYLEYSGFINIQL